MNNDSVYRNAFTLRGRTFQIDLMVEECAELIQAAQKYNHRDGSYENVIEELADVEIMCEQMRIIFDPVKIDKVKKQKIERLVRFLGSV